MSRVRAPAPQPTENPREQRATQIFGQLCLACGALAPLVWGGMIVWATSALCDDRYSMSVRFSSAGVACVGRARFRVWPPPLRERPQWEGHLHNSRNGRSNGTIYASTCVRETHVSPGSVGTTTALQNNSNFQFQSYPETDN